MLRPIGILLVTFAACSLAQNTAPVVNAGNDTTTRLGIQFRFKATITDDTLPSPHQMTGSWALVAGAADGVTFSPTFTTVQWNYTVSTLFVFSKIGSYTFALTASDGALSNSDHVTITVGDSIPFKILTPKAGDTVYIGDSVLVSWQIDPIVAVLIQFSSDGGLSTHEISPEAVRGTTSWYWHVPTDSAPTNQGMLVVRTYEKNSMGLWKYAYQSPTILMRKPQGVISVRSTHRTESAAPQEFYLIDGRRLAPDVHPNRGPGLIPGRVLICRTQTATKIVLER